MEDDTKQEAPKANSDLPPLKPLPEGEMTVGQLVDRLEELVKFTLECEQRKLRDDISFVDVYRQLLEIRSSISILSKEQEDLLRQITIAAASEEDTKIPFAPEDRKVFTKIKNLQDLCEAARERLHAAMEKNPEVEKVLQEQILESTTPERRKKIRRKGKFRPLGGKEGWIPT